MISRSMMYLLKRWRIGHPGLVPYSLHRSGSYAGHVDHFAGGLVRGWVYDAKRHDAILSVDICIDGQAFARLKVDNYRSDLAQLLGDKGLHGFSGKYDIDKASVGRLLSVCVADRATCVVGSAPAPVRQRRIEDFPPEKWSCLMFGLSEKTSDPES